MLELIISLLTLISENVQALFFATIKVKVDRLTLSTTWNDKSSNFITGYLIYLWAKNSQMILTSKFFLDKATHPPLSIVYKRQLWDLSKKIYLKNPGNKEIESKCHQKLVSNINLKVPDINTLIYILQLNWPQTLKTRAISYPMNLIPGLLRRENPLKKSTVELVDNVGKVWNLKACFGWLSFWCF